MLSNPPVDFEEKVRGPRGSSNADYPYAIKSSDLMRNFVFATLDLSSEIVEEITGLGGHAQRRLRLNAGEKEGDIAVWDGQNWSPLSSPGAGTFVLGAVDGVVQWIETESCDE
jgi:hypothetical protein